MGGRIEIRIRDNGNGIPVIYEVGTEEIDRLRSMLADSPQQRAEKKRPNLFMFNAVSQLVVGVSPAAIQLAHLLVEGSSNRHLEQENGDLDPERSHIHLYFRGRTEPYKIGVAESGDAAVLYFQLETGTFEASEFYSFKQTPPRASRY